MKQTFEQYITHIVCLWLDNDQGMYNSVLELRDSYYDKDEPWAFEEALKSHVEDLVIDENPQASMQLDIITSALAWVNWKELAEAYTEDLQSESI